MSHVLVGQTWSIAGSSYGDRVLVRIEAIVDGLATFASVATGRVGTIRATTLHKGLRASRLERNADGSPYVPMVPTHRGREIKGRAVVERTASDYVKIRPPRGALSDRALKVAALRRDGLTREQIAERLGLSVSSVARYLAQARQEGVSARVRAREKAR